MLALALGAAIAGASAVGQVSIAVAMVGLAIVLVLLGLIQLRRRVSLEINWVRLEAVRLAELLEANQQRILATVENERLAAADRQAANQAGERRILAAVENERLAAADRQAANQAGERRILAAVESERLAAADRDRALTSRLDELRDSIVKSDEGIAASHRRLGREATARQLDQLRETEALLQLFRDLEPRAPMPSSGGWALNPMGLLEVLSLVRRKRPRLVLELGSGTSTVWIAYALEQSGGRLISLDHDLEYANRTRSLLTLHGLDEVADVRHAPLQPVAIADEHFQWYDADAFKGIDGIELLLVDGPPKATGPAARYPAMHVLKDSLAAGAAVVLDDASRTEEEATLRRWLAEHLGLRMEPEVFGRQAIMTYLPPSQIG